MKTLRPELYALQVIQRGKRRKNEYANGPQVTRTYRITLLKSPTYLYKGICLWEDETSIQSGPSWILATQDKGQNRPVCIEYAVLR